MKAVNPYRFFSLLLILAMVTAVFPMPATAAEDPPSKIIFFQDDFSNDSNWNGAAPWTVQDNAYHCTIDAETTPNTLSGLSYAPSEVWTDYRFGIDVTVEKGAQNSAGQDTYTWVGLMGRAAGLTTYQQDMQNYEFRIQITPSGYMVQLFKAVTDGGVRSVKAVPGTSKTYPATLNFGAGSLSYRAELEFLGTKIRGYLDGALVLEYDVQNDASIGDGEAFAQPHTTGTIGLRVMRIEHTGTYSASFSNVIVEEASEVVKPPLPEDPAGTADWAKGSDEFRTVFADDFSAFDPENTTWDWEMTDTSAGDWSVSDGVLCQNDETSNMSSIALFDGRVYPFGSVAASVMLTSTNANNLYAGPVAAYNGSRNYYHLRIADMANGNDALQLYRMDGGSAVSLASVRLEKPLERNTWYRLEMDFRNGVISGYLDGELLLTYTPSEEEPVYEVGSAGIRISQGAAKIDHFAVKIPRDEARFFDSFDSASLEETLWSNNLTDSSAGDWSLSDGTLVQADEGTKATSILLYEDEQELLFGGVSADFMFTSANTCNLYAGPVAAYGGSRNYYHLRLGDMADGRNLVQLYQMTGGSAQKVAEAELPFEIQRSTWYNLDLFQLGGVLYGCVDNVLYIRYEPEDGIAFTQGLTGVRVSQGAAKIDNFCAYGAEGTLIEEDYGMNTVVENPLLFIDDFSDETTGSSPDYWLENNQTDHWKVAAEGENLIYGCAESDVSTTTWLHVFETNIDFSAKLKVPSPVPVDAKAGLVIRMSGRYAQVRIGYDFAQFKWYVSDRKGLDFDEQTIYAAESSSFPVDAWNTVRVRAIGKTLQVYCNEALVLKTDQIGQVTTGRVGLFTENTPLVADEIFLSLLSGQGRVEKAALANYVLPLDEYAEGSSLFWVSDSLAIINYKSKLFLSFDQGQSFRPATDEEAETYRFFAQNDRTQYIRLHTGNILKIDNYTGGKAYLSTDNGATYTQVGQLWDAASLEKNWAFYGGMNDMIKEVRLQDGSYRVFYCADVRAYGNPQGTGSIDHHWEEIYYTDDEGYTWQKSRMDTRLISALNHVCESRIVACADGDLRMYCSWNDSNCFRYYESHDNGETWEGEYSLPLMRCARSSHALMEDPYDPGTTYMVFVYCEPAAWKAVQPRTRLVLVRSTDGKNWEFLMDAWRWDDVPDDRVTHINQIVDPSITVTEDYVFVLSGWSEESGSTYHQNQRQHILKLKKSDLTPYEEWPDIYQPNAKEITSIEALPPTRTLYEKGEALELDGGRIRVHYYDGSSEEISMSASGIAISEPDLNINYTSVFSSPDMEKTGVKILRTDYKNFGANFTIQVVEPGTAADYTAVKDALKQIPDDLSAYTPESVSVLQKAVDSVDWNQTAAGQAAVNQYAQDILQAIRSLQVPAAESYISPIQQKKTPKSAWVLEGTVWRYYDSNGRIATGWQKIKGAWYYLRWDGSMATGWQKVDGTWYYLYSWGGMARNVWIKGLDQKWYYLLDWGGMAENRWVKWLDQKWYCLGPDGAMFTSTITPDGYRVGLSGEWIP